MYTGVTGNTEINMCLHHARNTIAVQNNALISTIIFYFETSELILSTLRDVTPQAPCSKCFANQMNCSAYWHWFEKVILCLILSLIHRFLCYNESDCSMGVTKTFSPRYLCLSKVTLKLSCYHHQFLYAELAVNFSNQSSESVIMRE